MDATLYRGIWKSQNVCRHTSPLNFFPLLCKHQWHDIRKPFYGLNHPNITLPPDDTLVNIQLLRRPWANDIRWSTQLDLDQGPQFIPWHHLQSNNKCAPTWNWVEWREKLLKANQLWLAVLQPRASLLINTNYLVINTFTEYHNNPSFQ